MDKYSVRVTFTETLLGTTPKDKEIYAKWVAHQEAVTDEMLEEELSTVQEVEEKGWTGFHVKDGQLILYDYVLGGVFKHACGALRRVSDTRSAKLRAYKMVINDLVFIKPRQIPIHLPEGAELGMLERPLRGQTAQGERVLLARSVTCPPGTWIEFEIWVVGVISEALLREWLDHGALYGMGQWRNAGWGTFEYEMTKLEA